MTGNLALRTVEAPDATEIYIAATPKAGAPLGEQALQVFTSIRDELAGSGATILHERVFATEGAMDGLRDVRAEVYGDMDMGVEPSWLVVDEGLGGSFAGVQVHAVTSDSRAEVVELDGVAKGRLLTLPGRRYLVCSGITAAEMGDNTSQAKGLFEKAQSILERFGADFTAVPRVWMWLADMLSWYGEFNAVRTKFFIEKGILVKGRKVTMPASTGIGIGPAGGGACGMDMIAVLEPRDSIEDMQAAGKQHSPFEYGSAFSRASRAVTPAGETVYVSGTASIDASGATTNLGDAQGQIEAAIENVRAVLEQMQCSDEDVVEVMAYCKKTEVEKVFAGIRDMIDWPWVTMICDVCRGDLLFEIEVTAMHKSSRIS